MVDRICSACLQREVYHSHLYNIHKRLHSSMCHENCILPPNHMCYKLCESWHHRTPLLGDARFTVYEDEREVIVTNVSTCCLQRQSNKGKLSSNEVFEWPSLHIEHTTTTTHNKTTQMQTFLSTASNRLLLRVNRRRQSLSFLVTMDNLMYLHFGCLGLPSLYFYA